MLYMSKAENMRRELGGDQAQILKCLQCIERTWSFYGIFEMQKSSQNPRFACVTHLEGKI